VTIVRQVVEKTHKMRRRAGVERTTLDFGSETDIWLARVMRDNPRPAPQAERPR